MKEKLKQTKGITLIALIITIIILLILAVVSINLVINQRILEKTKYAADQYSEEEEKEKLKLEEVEKEMEKYSGGVKTELTVAEANKEGWRWADGKITDYYGTATELYIPRKIGDMTITGIYSTGSKDDFVRLEQEKITKVVVPGTITTIEGGTFYNFTNLEEIILEEGIEEIGTYAFYNCNALETIILPSTINKIRIYGFALSGIRNMIIPNTVTNMEKSIFGWCTGGSVTINCEAELKPDAWDDAWFDYVPDGSTVSWGYKEN